MILISVIFTSTREYESTPSLPRLTSNLATTSNEIHATRRPWWIESTAFEILNSVLTCANYHGRLFCITERKRERGRGGEGEGVEQRNRWRYSIRVVPPFFFLQLTCFRFCKYYHALSKWSVLGNLPSIVSRSKNDNYRRLKEVLDRSEWLLTYRSSFTYIFR